jgi:hypothetical protein
MLRIKHIDSTERITDFSSAADHGVSLQKWQEMNLPITMPVAREAMKIPGRSVFEEDTDFTATQGDKKSEDSDNRWKFSGPWLAGMIEGDFKKYLIKRVRSRRPEFRQFLREELAAELSNRATSEAQDKGEPAPAVLSPGSITDEQLTNFLRELRNDRPRLYGMCGRFLDLPPLQAPKDPWGFGKSRESKVSNPYAQDGPPITHPSAGLTYLRTASYLDNHPVYGPQKFHAPVKARIVMPRNQPNGGRGAKLGVGGFITDAPAGDTTFNMRSLSPRTREMIPGIDSLDPNIEGGAKVYIDAMSARINSQGRVILKAGQAEAEAELVAKEAAGEEVIFEEPKKQPTHEATPTREADRIRSRVGKLGNSGPPVMGSAKTYGLDIPPLGV